MCAKWKGGFKVRLLASCLEKAKKINKVTEDVTFDGFETPDIVTVFQSSVEFARKLPEHEERSILWQLAFSVAPTATITEK